MGRKKSAFELEINGKTRKLQWKGFTSAVNQHGHYMKHVARVNAVRENTAHVSEKTDPERWHELWKRWNALRPNTPKLPVDLHRRKLETKRRLRATLPRCPLANRAPTAKNICRNCFDYGGNETTVAAVGAAFAGEMFLYEEILWDALAGALEGEAPGSKPCFFVQREPMTGDLSIVALSEDRVFVVVLIDEEKGIVRAKTGYRPICGNRLQSYRQVFYDFCANKRAVKATKHLVESSPVKRDAMDG